MKYLISAFIILLMSCQSTAQVGKKEYSTENKKAIKLYEEATAAFTLREYDKAEGLFLDAINKDENFTDAYIVLGELYLKTGKLNKAKSKFEESVSIEPKKFMETYYYLGELYISDGDYAAAKKNLELYTMNVSKSSPMRSRAELSLRNCSFALEAIQNPVPFIPVNMGPSVNTADAEYYPTLTVNESELLFTRQISNPNAFKGSHEDFFKSSKSDSEWSEAENLRNVNTIMNEGAPSLSANGKLLFFTACELYDDYGAGRNGFGSCDIFYTFKKGDNWSEAMNLGGEVNSSVWETQPSFSADGKTLYFVRGVSSANGYTQQDIWYTELQENGKWTKPSKIPGAVNTSYAEESVFIHPDGETLYFSSRGHAGMGGLDLFVSRMQKDGSWGEPQNLGYPINTSKDENSLLVSAGGELAIFASDREGGFGDLDLYHFELPAHIRPKRVTYAQGLIYDEKNFRPLEASFELIDLASGNSVSVGSSDATSGDFLIPLPTGKEYMVNVSREGYLFHSENFKLTEDQFEDAYELNIGLKKISAGNSVVLENVFFDTDSYQLREESKLELGKLVSFMKLNPNVIIEIGGHTDDVGSDENNLALSESRALSVKKHLVEAGLEEDRVSAKGYGETKPLESNDTEAGRAKNRRTEFTVK